MKFYKNDLQKYLNSFSWDFREIFFENSKNFNFSLVNGKFKVPAFGTLKWFSVLSRTWEKEYFNSFSGLENIEDKILEFKNTYNLNDNNSQITLDWADFLEINDEIDLLVDFSVIVWNIENIYKEIVKKHSFITWVELSLIFSKKNYLVANTKGNFAKDKLFYNTVFVKLIGEKDSNREEVFEKITWINVLDRMWFDELKDLFENSIKTLEMQLSGMPSPDWKIDVVIWNEAWGTIIHEAVWHWLEADLQNSSIYKDRIWEMVASPLVTIVDNPTLANHRGYYEFDHEWFSAQNTVLIDKWELVSYLHNEKTAQKFWVSSTWHGRRETYRHKTLVRMWNTYMLPWNSKKEDVIASVKSGLYISRMWWGQVNTVTWDFVFKVQSGYLIEDWKLTKNVRWAMLSGNWPEMLNEIMAVCDDLNFFDWWTCWKWQSMPVSDATPTVLTKLKVSGL